MSKLIKSLLKSLCQIQCAEVLLEVQLSHSPYTFLSSQSHFPHPSQKSIGQRIEMTYNRRLTNITAPVVRGLYCSSTQNLIKVWNHGKCQASLLSLFSYRSILNNAPTAHHYITWHLGISDERFLARLNFHPIFLMYSRIFSISGTSCSLVIRWTYQHYILAIKVKNSAKVKLLSFNRTAVFLSDTMVSENDVLEVR